MEEEVKILFTGKNYAQGLKHNDPKNYLWAAESLGHVSVQSFSEQPGVVVCVDYTRQSLRKVRQARKRNIKTVLICCEPSVVIPQNNQERIAKLFDKIARVGRPHGIPLKWPQTWRAVNTNRTRLNRAIMVNADKWSYVKGQLYWLRAALASSETRLDTAGHGWHQKILRRLIHRIYELLRTLTSLTRPSLKGLRHILDLPINYVGTPDDKVNLMAKYKIALVIENSQELITEKLFDAWFAGCIPVYVGPEVAPFGIPKGLVVCAKPTLMSVRFAIDEAMRLNHDRFIEELVGFLDSSNTLEWQSDKALQKIISYALK